MRCLFAPIQSYLTRWNYVLKDFLILTHPDIPILYSKLKQISSKKKN